MLRCFKIILQWKTKHSTKTRYWEYITKPITLMPHSSFRQRNCGAFNGNLFPSKRAKEFVNYRRDPLVNSIYPDTCNIFMKITFLPQSERSTHPQFYIEPVSGKQKILRPEQKSADWLMDIIESLCPPGGFVANLFSCTFSTARA